MFNLSATEIFQRDLTLASKFGRRMAALEVIESFNGSGRLRVLSDFKRSIVDRYPIGSVERSRVYAAYYDQEEVWLATDKQSSVALVSA